MRDEGLVVVGCKIELQAGHKSPPLFSGALWLEGAGRINRYTSKLWTKVLSSNIEAATLDGNPPGLLVRTNA
jgi:hypothetical protein